MPLKQLTSVEIEELKNRFCYHPPTPDQVERYQMICERAHDLATVFSICCPNSRELSTAMTQLQLAVMLANAAIACNE